MFIAKSHDFVAAVKTAAKFTFSAGTIISTSIRLTAEEGYGIAMASSGWTNAKIAFENTGEGDNFYVNAKMLLASLADTDGEVRIYRSANHVVIEYEDGPLFKVKMVALNDSDWPQVYQCKPSIEIPKLSLQNAIQHAIPNSNFPLTDSVHINSGYIFSSDRITSCIEKIENDEISASINADMLKRAMSAFKSDTVLIGFTDNHITVFNHDDPSVVQFAQTEQVNVADIVQKLWNVEPVQQGRFTAKSIDDITDLASRGVSISPEDAILKINDGDVTVSAGEFAIDANVDPTGIHVPFVCTSLVKSMKCWPREDVPVCTWTPVSGTPDSFIMADFGETRFYISGARIGG